MFERVGRWYCRHFHKGVIWKTHEYECPRCFRRYPLPGGETATAVSRNPKCTESRNSMLKGKTRSRNLSPKLPALQTSTQPEQRADL
jgi:hypothetical protein